MKKLKKYLEGYKEPRILDAATGQGAFISMIISVYYGFSKIIGIDSSDKAVGAANRNFEDPRISIQKMDANDMEFDDGYFDIACLSNSMHHMDDIGHTISQMVRVTGKDGILVFNEMRSDNLTEKQKTHKYLHHFWADIDRYNGIIHKKTMTGDEILGTIADHPEIKVIDSWELEHDETQEMTDEVYEWLKNTIDIYVNRAKDIPGYEDICKKADELKDRLDKIGFEPAAQVVVIAGRI